MNSAVSGINPPNSIYGLNMTGLYAQAVIARTSPAKTSTVNQDVAVTLSTTSQIQSLKNTGAGVNELAEMFGMPTSLVEDDLGMYPTSTRSLVKSAPIADPNHPDQSRVDSEQYAHVQLSTAAQVQSMSQTGASVVQIAALLGMTTTQVSAELGIG